jgi:hypothetical protein
MKSSRIRAQLAISFALVWPGWAAVGSHAPAPPAWIGRSVYAAPGVAAVGRRDGLQQLAASYIDDYQRQLTAIVADEVYVQEIRSQVPAEDGPRSRRLRGEVFFLFAAAEREWMAIRDVQEVDGTPLRGTTDVRETLRTLPPAQVADRMKSYNARYNIGRIARNINEPTLALLVLDASHRSRFKFKTGKPRQVGDRALVPLSFKERERPTLIRSPAGDPIYSSGELLVEPGTGRIWQSTLDVSVDAIKVQLTTDYAFDGRLNLLLPALFRERYEQGSEGPRPGSRESRSGAAHELIVAEGRYSNFRRFEVLSRVR